MLKVIFESVIETNFPKSGGISHQNNPHLNNIYQYGGAVTKNSIVYFPEFLSSKTLGLEISKGLMQLIMPFLERGSYQVIYTFL